MRPGYKFLLLAVTIPLCWLPLAYVDSVLVNRFGFLKNTGLTAWQKMSLLRLAICGLFFWIIVPFFLKKKFGDSYADIMGLNFKKTDFLALALFLIVPFALSFFFQNPVLAMQKNATGFVDFIANMQPPLIEEAAFRGIFFYLMYKGGFKNRVIILVGALLFGSIHLPFYGSAAMLTGLLGIVLFILPRIFTKNITQGFLLHFMANSNLMVPVFIGNGIVFLIMMIMKKCGIRQLLTDYNLQKT